MLLRFAPQGKGKKQSILQSFAGETKAGEGREKRSTWEHVYYRANKEISSVKPFIIGKYLSSFPILVGVSKFCIISEFKDWFESESRAPGALITSGMSPLSVYSQISDERFKGPTQPGSIAMAEGAKQLG